MTSVHARGGPFPIRSSQHGGNRQVPADGFGIRVPGFGFRVPGFGLRVQVFGLRVPSFELRIPAFWFLVPGFGFPSSDFWCREHGSGTEAAETCPFRVSGSRFEILYEKTFNLKKYGNKVDCTIARKDHAVW